MDAMSDKPSEDCDFDNKTVDSLLSELVDGEMVLEREDQYALTLTKHIKLRSVSEKSFGKAYQQASSIIKEYFRDYLDVPKIIKTGSVEEYEYVITERIVRTRETRIADLEEVLRVLELSKTNEPPFIGSLYQDPVFLIDGSLDMKKRFENLAKKLYVIGYEEDDFEELYGNINPQKMSYHIQHGDLCPRNVIIGPNEKMYLVDLDTVGFYYSHFERTYMVASLGLPMSINGIGEELIQIEAAIICLMRLDEKTTEIKSIVDSVKKRLDLIKTKQISGLQNILSGIGIANRNRNG